MDYIECLFVDGTVSGSVPGPMPGVPRLDPDAAVEHVADGIAELGNDRFPVVERAVDGNGARSAGDGPRADPLEPAHPARKLVVVVVGMAAANSG